MKGESFDVTSSTTSFWFGQRSSYLPFASTKFDQKYLKITTAFSLCEICCQCVGSISFNSFFLFFFKGNFLPCKFIPGVYDLPSKDSLRMIRFKKEPESEKFCKFSGNSSQFNSRFNWKPMQRLWLKTGVMCCLHTVLGEVYWINCQILREEVVHPDNIELH